MISEFALHPSCLPFCPPFDSFTHCGFALVSRLLAVAQRHSFNRCRTTAA